LITNGTRSESRIGTSDDERDRYMKRNSKPDAVNHPPHYNAGPIEVIDVIEGFKLGFHLGNVVKYILRAPHKGAAIQDLKKAKWYLDRLIDNEDKASQ